MFPGIKARTVSRISIGWNSSVYLINSSHVLKVPRDGIERGKLQRERIIAEYVSRKIAVPVPEYTDPDGPTESVAYPIIPGAMLTDQDLPGSATGNVRLSELGDQEKEGVASELGGILRAVHSVDTGDIREAIGNHAFGGWKQYWRDEHEHIARSLGSVGDKLPMGTEEHLGSVMDAIFGLDYEEKFIHGDFGGWNILYDIHAGMITGIIDWGSAAIGDPAYDFAELAYDYGKGFAERVLTHYGTVDRSIMERAETYLGVAGFLDIAHGVDCGSTSFIRNGINRVASEMKA